MRRLLSVIWCLVCCLALAWGQSVNVNGDQSWTNTEYNTTEGTEFWVTFMRNSGSSTGDNNDMYLYLYATARENATVTVKNPNIPGATKTFNVRAGKQDSCLVDNSWAYIENDKVRSNFGIKVTSTKPISLYATNQHSSGKYDATNVLPSTALMGEYIVQTYRIDEASTEFAIVATTNQNVTIRVKKTTIDIPSYDQGIINVVSVDNSEVINLTMSAGQTYLYRSATNDGSNTSTRATSLSGTTICSDKPVALFVGGQHVKIPSNPDNHIFSQAYPTDKWGKTFIVTPTYKMVYDYVQITACQDGTQIRRDGNLVATINAKETFIDTIKSDLYYATIDDFTNEIVTYVPKIVTYTTSKVAECFLYATSQSANHPSLNGKVMQNVTFDYGAPVLTPIIPQELAMKSSMFATFTKTNTSLKHYVNIVTPTAEVSGMRLDNVNISADFQPITGTNYSYAIKEVSNQAHKIENVRGGPNSTFTARAYGLGKSSTTQESYAYAVGSRISRKADVLINGQYIKEKTICITQSISLTGLIEGEYTSYRWNFDDTGGTTTGGTSLNPTHTFSSAGDYDVELVVTRPYPYICSHNSGLGQNGNVQDHVHVTIHVKDKYEANFEHKICEGQTVELKGRDENGNIQTYTYSTNTNETKKFYTVDGCDSIVRVKIQVGQPETKRFTVTECNEYTWHGTRYTESGTYNWTGKTEYDCDLTEILELTILKPVQGPKVEKTLCRNSLPYIWNGQSINKPGSYTATLQAANGCDSIAKLEVKVEDEYREEITAKPCYGESYEWRGRILTEANTYEEKRSSPNGCDSTFILHLSFYPDYSHITKTDETCADKPYRFGDQMLTESGTYTKTFKTADGCDSTVTLTLTVWPLEYDTIYASICQGESYPFDGKQLKTEGKYTKTEQNAHHCTKTTVLYLTVNPVTHRYDTIRICEKGLPYTYAGKYIADKEGIYEKVLDTKNQYGCDSVYHLNLIVDKTIVTPLTVHRCDYDAPYNHPDPRATELQNLTKDSTYRSVLQAVNGCDSVIELRLIVGKRTYYTMPVTVCDAELPWADPNRPGLQLRRDTTYNDTIPNAMNCDSVITVQFKVHETYHVTQDITICEMEAPYNHPDKRFTLFQNLDHTQTITQTIPSAHQCDSTVTLNLTVNPTTYKEVDVLLCEEALPYAYGENGKEAKGKGVYRDTLRTKNQYGCDSILIVHLEVMTTIIDRQEVTLCDNELPYNHPDSRATKLQNLQNGGTYRDTLKTISGCDSIIELHLQVWETYEVDERQYICDYEEFDFHGHLFRNMQAQDEPYRLDTTLKSIHGCDSVVHLYLTVWQSYKIPSSSVTVCQNKENPNWEWRDEDGTLHGIVSIAEPREIFLADTLKTIHDCDSIFGIQLRIIPSYREDSLYTICQNEHITWQGKAYCGNKADPIAGERVLAPGLYYDTVMHKTAEGCDSIFYLQLRVYEIYETDIPLTVCDNEDAHAFHLSDTQGTVIDDDLPFEPTPSEEGVTKPTIYIDRDYMLQTIHGCDSVIHLHLTVQPTYEFVTRAKVCGTEDYLWRDRMYYETGTYYDSLWTKDQCDSVYVLELFKKPMVLIPRYDTICDNETYEHLDTMWYTNGSHTLVETMVWTPGMPIPQSYSDVTFRSKDDGCDSIVFRYWLKINKTFNYHDTAVICSNISYQTELHTYTGYEYEYDTDQYIAPYDTVIRNQYSSVNGCDSIYNLHARMYPTYRHRDTITICDDETADWRGHHYAGSMLGNVLGNGLPAGEHVFRDSLLTHDHGCDSIYELHLMVMPTYLFVDSITKCADEDLSWRSFNLDHVLPGEYFYYDSLTTVTYGCDSVYHLYLNVLDTTYEVRHDSICETETYYLHGVALTEPGFYKDTTLNAWGCHHFTYLYLYVIPPTVPTAWADSICADDKSYELFYSYTGPLDPVAYSVYYDDFGHKYGFEDIINEPITTADQLHTLILPMPWRDDDYHKYPRPDYYNIRLTLDNGVCTNPDMCSTDTSIVLSYPSWVTEQRFRDVIAILSTDYNGGYTFSHYQWYRNNEPIPGETLPYLYIPRGLEQDTTWYHVRVVRVGETQDFQTCPIRIYDDFGTDTIAPYMGYLSVVPTCISTSNPVMSILSRHEGYYRIYNETGLQLATGVFRPEVTEVTLYGMAPGVYFVLLDSDATPEEPHRSIKILLKDGDRTW